MSGYTAPLEDIRFVLDHIAELGDLVTLDRFRHAERDLVWSVLDEGARFVQDLVAPLNQVGDLEGSTLIDGQVRTPSGFQEMYKAFVNAGWGGIDAPSQWGGHEMPRIVGVAIEEMFTSANLAFSNCPLLTSGAVTAIAAHGTEEQKDGYLPKLITGEWSAAMNLTEPQAGSDLGVLTMRAVPAEDGTYRLRGTKIFITYGDHDMAANIVHLVLARVPGSPPRTRGISMFIVPKFLPDHNGEPGKPNDLKAVSLEHKLGIKASPTCVMAYGENAGGAVGFLLGGVNKGMHNMFSMMNTARISVAVQGMGVAERAYQQAVAFARERRQGRAVGAKESSPIIDHPDVRRMLLTMRSNTEAMRALLYRAAMHQDLAKYAVTDRERRWHANCLALLTPVVKTWCTDLGVEVASVGIQVHGGMGYIEETGAAQHLRDARIAPIYEGTNGIQSIDLVMRKLPIDGWPVRGRLPRLAASFRGPPARPRVGPGSGFALGGAGHPGGGHRPPPVADRRSQPAPGRGLSLLHHVRDRGGRGRDGRGRMGRRPVGEPPQAGHSPVLSGAGSAHRHRIAARGYGRCGGSLRHRRRPTLSAATSCT